MVSPRTRKLPRAKSMSLRWYCMRTSWAMASRWPSLSPARSVIIIGGSLRRANAVDGRDTVATITTSRRSSRLWCTTAHLLDVLVDGAVLLDEQVALGHVGLGLVVVVVADEILHRVLGKNSRNSL